MNANVFLFIFFFVFHFRDVSYLGDCDAGVDELVKFLGWQDDFQRIIDTRNKELKKRWRWLKDLDNFVLLMIKTILLFVFHCARFQNTMTRRYLTLCMFTVMKTHCNFFLSLFLDLSSFILFYLYFYSNWSCTFYAVIFKSFFFTVCFDKLYSYSDLLRSTWKKAFGIISIIYFYWDR